MRRRAWNILRFELQRQKFEDLKWRLIRSQGDLVNRNLMVSVSMKFELGSTTEYYLGLALFFSLPLLALFMCAAASIRTNGTTSGWNASAIKLFVISTE